MLQVSASSFAQKVTYIEKKGSLLKLFKEIKKQTGFNVVWSEDKLNVAASLNANFRKAPLEEVMTKSLDDLDFTYVIVKKTIVIKEKELSLFDKVIRKFQSIEVRGIVKGENDEPLSGASIRVKGAGNSTTANNKGEFVLKGVEQNAILVISYLGYEPKEILAKPDLGVVKLAIGNSELSEVQIMSTGYQNIPKERATGSFVQIDNTLLNRSVSTNILDRLDGVTSGLIFTSPVQGLMSAKSQQSPIEIHGRSTLFANPNPLIVLDNFPYDGDLNNINPNDIESITILKDAAAASAWGTRSGNGVIVITTKKGNLNTAPKVAFNANVNIGKKPDLYYSPQLTSSQFIDVQQFLYNKGAYDNNINDGYSLLPPAVEIFRNPSDPNYQAKLNALRNYDVRDQLLKYFYRPSVNQQYEANVSGGSNFQKYFVSAGYDRNLASAVGNSYDRVTLNASNTYYFLNKKLELFSNIIYTGSKNKAGRSYFFSNPYDQVADANGNSLPVANTLRLLYAQTAGDGQLLNWLYKPLDELNNRYNTTTTNLTDYRLNFSLAYHIMDGLKAAAFYNYEKGVSDKNTLFELQSFYTRNLINQYTQIDQEAGTVTHPLPIGDIYSSQTTTLQSHNGRFQVNYDNSWGKHSLSALAGAEIRELSSNEIHNQFYGYNRETGSNQNASVNFTIDNPFFYGSNTGRISTGAGTSGINNRFFSYYFNGSYTYADRYIASVSAREDESNLFGVSTNQKGVPLWSGGLAWILNKEEFYNLGWLPQLKLRATYGYTGNVDNTLSAYLTAQATSDAINNYGALYSTVINPPNPSLRWEKVRNINLGIDFSLKNNRIGGSIDLWQKKGIDLIGNSPIAPQTGIITYTGNSANTLTKGIDVQINSVNLYGPIKWYTTLLYNYSSSKVTSYGVSNGTNYNVVSSNYNNPLPGFPYYSIFSFKYAGLNGSGDPQGYLNGVVSTDYSNILNSMDRKELTYIGSATPTSYGNLLNTVTYKNFDFSFNISYRFGYYFRRNSLDNSSLYSGLYKYADYENRWQKPGDENHTIVPALIYPGDTQRDAIYLYSDALIEKADNIRLKDIRLGYTFPKRSYIPFKNLNLFTYVNNLGILWRANSNHLDPDYPTGIPQVRTIAFGLKADL